MDLVFGGIIFRAMPSVRATAGSLCSVAFGEKNLLIPIAYFTKFYVLKSASMVLALKNMLHPKIQKPVGGMRCLSRSALHAI